MKIKDEIFFQDDKLVHHRQYDPNPVLASVAAQKGNYKFGESYHVADIPVWLAKQWCDEAGVKWTDTPARDEVMKRKILSGEYSALRNWEGTY